MKQDRLRAFTMRQERLHAFTMDARQLACILLSELQTIDFKLALKWYTSCLFFCMDTSSRYLASAGTPVNSYCYFCMVAWCTCTRAEGNVAGGCIAHQAIWGVRVGPGYLQKAIRSNGGPDVGGVCRPGPRQSLQVCRAMKQISCYPTCSNTF